MRQIVLFFALLISTVISASGIFGLSKKKDIWSADNIQMVHLRDSNRYCCNPDGVISQEFVDSIDYYCKKLEHKGIQSVIVIVNEIKDEDTFRAAQDIGNRYGVGDKETRRGLVVVVAYKQRKFSICPGNGLEAELTDVECSHIAEDYLKPQMRDEHPGDAMLNTVKAIYNKIDYGVAELYKGQIEHDKKIEDIFCIIVIVIFVIFVFICIATKGEFFFVFLDVIGSDGSSSGGSFGGGSFGGGGCSGSW